VFCPKCGTMSGERNRFCSNCGFPVHEISGLSDTENAAGQAVKEAVAQTSAGAVNGPGTMISGVTGAVDAVSTGVVQAVGATVKAAGVTVKGKILAGAVAAGIVAASIVVFNLFFVAKPMDTVEKFVNAVNEKDINTMVECLDPKYEKAYKATSNIFSNFIGGVKITDVVDLFPAIYEIAKTESGDQTDMRMAVKKVISEKREGDRADIKLVIEVEKTDKAGKITTEQGIGYFYLKKYNDGWRIIDLK